MDIPRLLIAGSDEFCQSVTQSLDGSMQALCCHNGRQTLALLQQTRPDILLLELMLPDMDGLAVLRAAAAEGIHPQTLVVMDFRSAYAIEALTSLQVSYMMLKPCDPQILLSHLSDIAAMLQPEFTPTAAEPASREAAAAALLLELGMRPKWDGFRFLRLATPRFFDDPHQSVTKELYVDIGRPFGKGPKLVERNIRSAIHKAWAQGNPAVWRKYFPAAPDGAVPRPSNKHFISHIAQLLYAESRQCTG